MADPTSDELLRELAEHRGLKLVRSRRRKPGSGDYGKFGLTDLAGKPLLGIGPNGLEASRADIEAYLRGDAVGAWKASAKSTPARAGNRAVAPKSRPAARTPARPKRPEPPPEPELTVRRAKPADTTALMSLLRETPGIMPEPAALARNLEAVFKGQGGMVVAERGAVIGCCAFVVLATIQHGPVGRVTLLLVAEQHRRKGIGSALTEAAMLALRQAGCTQLEAMSDIAVNNTHGFFRALHFEQTSYRFAKAIETGR